MAIGGAVKTAASGGDAAMALKNVDNLVDLSRTDPAQFKQLLKNDEFIKSLKTIDADDLAEKLKQIDDVELAKIGKKLDNETIEAIRKANGGPDLVKKLKPNYYQRSVNYISKLTRGKIKTASDMNGNVKPGNPPRGKGDVDDMTDQLPKDQSKQNKEIARRTASDEGAVANATKANGELLEEGSSASNLLKQGIKELGYPLAMGAGVLLLLCMAYDTDNPFTAVDRALDDTGTVVRGFKEVAEEAAEAVKDTATGGFDFISFVTKNSWISFACSILCVILVFALFMMGMLGSMGGNNKR